MMKSTSTISESICMGKSNLAFGNNSFSLEAHQGGIVGRQGLEFQIQPLVQVGIHNLNSTALIHQHFLHIISPYLESDHQGVVMGLDGSNLILVQESRNRLDIHFGSFWLQTGVLGR